MNKYHTRESYERLYEWILRDTGSKWVNPKTMHIQELLTCINLHLRLSHCEPISYEEMDEITQSILLNQQS
jgi:hypothetical protein